MKRGDDVSGGRVFSSLSFPQIKCWVNRRRESSLVLGGRGQSLPSTEGNPRLLRRAKRKRGDDEWCLPRSFIMASDGGGGLSRSFIMASDGGGGLSRRSNVGSTGGGNPVWF
jgi:hypothetical protein